MNSGAAEKPRRRARRRVIAIAGVVILAVAAGFAWWLTTRRPDRLAPDWIPSAVVLAGTGVPGVRDGVAPAAQFSEPFGVAVAQDGSVFVSDAGDAHRVRRISPTGIVTTIAGGTRGFEDGTARSARFDTPSAIALAPDGALIVTDTANNAIRRIALDGVTTTLAGSGEPGHRDGVGHEAQFNGPIGVAVDRIGRVIVADTYNDRIRMIANGNVTTVAGSNSPGLVDAFGTEARFDTPCGVAFDKDGNIVVADSGNGAIRRIDANGYVATISGPGPEAISRPIGITTGENGVIFVTDERGRIVEIAAGGFPRTIAGSSAGFRDGPGADAMFRRPAGIATPSDGRLIVADAGNSLVRLLAESGRGDLRPPASARIAPRFDAAAFAARPVLWPVQPMEGPHEVAGTMGESRGGEGTERLHSGIDVRIDQGTPVVAVREGVVSNPFSTGAFGTLNEWMRIGDVTYVHIRAGRDLQAQMLDASRFVPTFDDTGVLTRVRIKRGTRFATGEVIGSVNQFNHVHVNVGWSGEELNPLDFRLPYFEDTIAPTIARTGVRLFDEQLQPLTQRVGRRTVVAGRVQVVVDAWDLSNGNRPGRRLGLYSLGYQVLNPDGTPVPGFEVPRETIRFDRMSHDPDDVRLVFAPGSGIPFYGRRVTRFLYLVTNSFHDGQAEAGYWDTTLLAPGAYVLRVHGADIRGNTAVRDLAVTVVPVPVPGAIVPGAAVPSAKVPGAKAP
jgi:sugar lactone lactonase YvrE